MLIVYVCINIFYIVLICVLLFVQPSENYTKCPFFALTRRENKNSHLGIYRMNSMLLLLLLFCVWLENTLSFVYCQNLCCVYLSLLSSSLLCVKIDALPDDRWWIFFSICITMMYIHIHVHIRLVIRIEHFCSSS